MEIKEGVICRDRTLRWITPSEISIILHMIRKPNSIIVILFIQNDSQFKNIAKTCLPPSMLSSSSIVYIYVCPAPQIFSKQQMSPSDSEAYNTLRDLHNSSYGTKAEFNNCFIIHSKYFLVCLPSCLLVVFAMFSAIISPSSSCSSYS